MKEQERYIEKYRKKDPNEYLIKLLGKDFARYRKEFERTQKGIPSKFPITLALEPVNRCNLNCEMCYKPPEPIHSYSLGLLKKLHKECKGKLPSAIIGLGNEPMMYANLKALLDMLQDAGVQDIFFGTNGQAMDSEIVTRITANRVTRVEISVDAVTSETYSEIRGGSLERVENNINNLIRIRGNNPLPIIRLCFVVMDENRNEVEAFKKKWGDKVDYIDFQRKIDFNYVDEEVQIDMSALKYKFCPYPFYSLGIWANGDVSPCCTFYGKKLIFGNVNSQNIEEIWNGKKIKELRKQFKKGDLNNTCRKCLYFRE